MRVRPRGNVGSLSNSSSTSNLTCFFCFSSASVEVSFCHALLLDLWGLVCKSSCSMEQLSCSLAGWDCGGLGDDNLNWLGCEWEGLWCFLDLFLPWEHFLNPDHAAGASSFSQLADFSPQGLAEGDWVYEVEWPWECFQPLKEYLVSLCRLALAMHLTSSWCRSLMHSSCWWWGSILGATVHSPSKLVLHFQDLWIRGP